ncbi:MAG TPA: cytochrome c/FTR1 family iron permease [Burkholderiales bacterium]
MRALLAALALLAASAAHAQDAQTILHLLDYIGVDYPEAVADGKVVNPDEYKEMLEFTAQVSSRVAALPDNAGKKALQSQAAALQKLVQDKAGAASVAEASGKLRWAIVAAYKLRLAPRAPPDLARGKALYAQHCAACHGAQGRGDGPAAKGLEPPPSDFHDLARMAQRSAYGLYNTITLGVEGTGMASFRQLAEEDRWALAFYVASMGVPPERVRQGGELWSSGRFVDLFADLGPVATLSTSEMAARHGEPAARVQDYLRAHPEALRPAPLAYARQKLDEARQAYRRGERAAARDAAISAYLEGFELAEASLANVDASLMREIEQRMLELRGAIERGADAQSIERQADEIDALLAGAQEVLGEGGLSQATAFTASLVILLREGLEAILVLAAIIAFVAKTGRRDALPWVHAGWIAALVLGALTWVLATFVIRVSGANRELTEGITALLAAALLLYVGYWLHGKSYAQAWARFITEQVGQALSKRTLWAMAAVSFLAVYREMFEIVLFYQALWAQGGEGSRTAVLGGAVAAALALAVIGFVLFRYSVRLPIGLFFGATSALLALLALVFTGHGLAALQEAGVLGVSALPFPPLPLLGIYPSVEVVAGQLVVALLVASAFFLARSRAAA